VPGAPARTGWRALLAALMLATCWLAFSPAPPENIDTGWDKLNHALAFAALAFCASRGFAPQRLLAVPASLLAFGGFIEIVQSQIPGRSAEWADLLADAVGITVVLVFRRLTP
jgi:VanZ family protein